MNKSIYIHIPFCRHRCHYCDFNTNTGKDALIPDYARALINEFRIVSEGDNGDPVHSLYFGGGTPSLIPVRTYEKLISELHKRFFLTKDCEISLEANPGTLSLNYLTGLRALGFNRISIGVQSTNPVDLQRLDRIHTVEDVLKSVYHAKKAGFKNINLDLIFALPGQNRANWKNSLQRAINLKPHHFSVYSLIIEPGTQLNRWYQRGLIPAGDQDLEADMYEDTMVLLEEAGYTHYEISNWHKIDGERDYRCRNNLQYWLNQPYYGFGAGAHGYINSIRTINVQDLEDYLQKLNHENSFDRNLQYPSSPATISTSVVDRETQMKEFMMLGLRLIKEGVSEKRFHQAYGVLMQAEFDGEIQYLLERDLIAWKNGADRKLCLTHRGILLANQVFMEFL